MAGDFYQGRAAGNGLPKQPSGTFTVMTANKAEQYLLHLEQRKESKKYIFFCRDPNNTSFLTASDIEIWVLKVPSLTQEKKLVIVAT